MIQCDEQDLMLATNGLYRMFVKSVLQQNGDERLGNDSDSHAIILIEELIRSAHVSVDIFCHSLAADVWTNAGVVDAVREAVKHGVTFRVAVQSGACRESRDLFNGLGIPIRLNGQTQLESNFMIVDRKAFRVEYNFARRMGFAYANKPEFSEVLNNAFYSIYQAAH